MSYIRHCALYILNPTLYPTLYISKSSKTIPFLQENVNIQVQYDRGVPTTVKWCFYVDVECVDDYEEILYDDTMVVGNATVERYSEKDKIFSRSGNWTIKV